jgi:hypothetical protein
LKKRSFWSVSIPHNCSWCWRKLLRLRDIVKKFLRFEVGDGKNIHLLMDFWHPAGILLEKYGFRAVYDAQSSVEAKLSSVIRDGEWFWRPGRSEALVDIQTRLTEIRLGHCDKPIWIASR